MHFPDLAPCHYHPGPLDADEWAVPLRAIGWLEHPHPFDVGAVPDGFVDKFSELVEQTRRCFAPYQFRGLHDCDHCMAAGFSGSTHIDRSSANVLIPGDAEVFAATAGVLHYVGVHAYLPPKAFIDAVMACPPCDSRDYLDALRKANAGCEPPLELGKVHLERSRRERAAASRFRDELGTSIKHATRAQVAAAAAKAWPHNPPAGAEGDVVLGRGVAQFDAAGRFVKFADE